MTCKICGGELVGKRVDAIYCTKRCQSQANKSKSNEYFSTTRGRSKVLWHAARQRAGEIEITPEWIQDILDSGVCQVTGLPFDIVSGNGKTPFAPSLDRSDPNLGYTVENTKVVVWIYNSAKNIFSHEDVLKLAKALVC